MKKIFIAALVFGSCLFITQNVLSMDYGTDTQKALNSFVQKNVNRFTYSWSQLALDKRMHIATITEASLNPKQATLCDAKLKEVYENQCAIIRQFIEQMTVVDVNTTLSYLPRLPKDNEPYMDYLKTLKKPYKNALKIKLMNEEINKKK